MCCFRDPGKYYYVGYIEAETGGYFMWMDGTISTVNWSENSPSVGNTSTYYILCAIYT